MKYIVIVEKADGRFHGHAETVGAGGTVVACSPRELGQMMGCAIATVQAMADAAQKHIHETCSPRHAADFRILYEMTAADNDTSGDHGYFVTQKRPAEEEVPDET